MSVDQENKEREITAVKKIVDHVDQQIRQVYGLESSSIPPASEFLWTESDDELKQLLGVDKLHPEASIYPITVDGQYQATIIYLNSKVRERLSTSTPHSRLKGDNFGDYEALVEEVSHYVYGNLYRQKYGQSSHSAMTELIGVVDKFNIIQADFVHTYGEIADPETQQGLFRINAGAYSPDLAGSTPQQYIIGHRLGVKYVGYLNHLANEGGDPSQELMNFYHAPNPAQLTHLLYDCGLDFETHSEQEKADTAKVFASLGVKAFVE